MKTIMMSLFKQKSTKLFNGTNVKEGDLVAFINSDKERCEDVIRRREFHVKHTETGEKLRKGTLFFWNITFNISDYENAFIV